jgi:enoyl-CoA hydratase/carnithine racemase
MYEQIRVDIRDEMAWLVMDRAAKRNAISIQMMEEIIDAFASLAEDRSVAVVVIIGEGGVFSAGWDRDELLDQTPATKTRFEQVGGDFYRALVRFPKPLVAAVGRYALGTAFDVATLCDVRVASDDVSFAHSEVRLGGISIFTPLKQILGDGWARWIILSGAPIDAPTAERIGLVTHVCPRDELEATARQVAAYIAEVPRETVEYTKTYLWTHPDPEEWLRVEFEPAFTRGLTIKRK